MFAEEWPLMTFTLLSQLAVGSFIVLVLVRAHFTHKNLNREGHALTNFGFKAVGVITALALVFSLFHLGDPLGAYRSIFNLGSSWLSREILTAGGFFVLWFITMRVYKDEKAGNVLGWVTAIVGLTVIYSMASIYATSIRPAWSSVNTYIAFYGATFAMGSLGAAILIAHAAKGKEVSAEGISLLKKVNILGGLAVILPLIYLPVYISGLASGVTAAQESAQIISEGYSFILILRAFISLAGVGLMYYGLTKKVEKKGLPLNLVLIAFVLVFAGEFIGRYVFYASGVSMMIGMM